MVQYKLTYFDFRGLGETARFILHYADVDFEDNRITKEEWEAIKPTMPYEQLPVLEVDGIKIPQSVAIYRFLARRFGLAGKTDIESALLDSIVDLQKDFFHEIGSWFPVAAGRKEGDKDKLYKEIFVPAAERYFPRLVKLLNESGSGFFAKSGVSWVDFFLANTSLTIKNFAPEMLDKYPELKDHFERVHALPQLQPYFAKYDRKDYPH
ncbi:glutathione S-transferase 1 [Ditylenchus destructor]|uniref:glutathione transferase n=1 Tax=Ditylenchus destructor TaxID=166010 RepID=A0AAD4MT69_9BILA|nr:glutathione S-transferase 1 [Ditylenchus destructor]